MDGTVIRRKTRLLALSPQQDTCCEQPITSLSGCHEVGVAQPLVHIPSSTMCSNGDLYLGQQGSLSSKEESRCLQPARWTAMQVGILSLVTDSYLPTVRQIS